MHRPPPALPIAVALAGVVFGSIAVTDSAFAGAAAAPEPVDAIAALLGAPQQWFGHDIAAWAADGYRRRPALMVGLAGFALMPLLVVAGMILRRLTRHTARRAHALNAVDVLPRSAWLELDGAPARTVPIRREVVQIGRQDDNDICIVDDSVHRYHAVIECSRDIGFVITDVSGPAGNGVRVNGERYIKSSLANGDVVEIGRARFRFATAA